MENSKRGYMKEEEFINFITALFMMENIEVISKKVEVLIRVIAVLSMMENIKRCYKRQRNL